MQFPTLTILLALTSSVLADLHMNAVCVDAGYGADTYNPTATYAACEAYKNRNTGNKQHDSCPDCYINTEGVYAYCRSDGWHMGGNEIEQYCKDAGASHVLTQ